MPRPKKIRKICNPPLMKGFRPFGMPCIRTGQVILEYEEYESIRMVNYLGLSHKDASKMMNISRPTFTRIYNRALKQIAKSFVECKTIVIEGGNFSLEDDWYRCKKCHKLIRGIENHKKCEKCPSYGDSELIKLN